MSRFQRKFTRIDRDESRLPDVISKASALVLVLFNAGKVEQAGKKLKVRRQGGRVLRSRRRGEPIRSRRPAIRAGPRG